MTAPLRTAEAAVELGVHPDTLRKWLRDGLLRGIKYGRTWHIERGEVATFKRLHTTGAARSLRAARPAPLSHEARRFLSGQMGRREALAWAGTAAPTAQRASGRGRPRQDRKARAAV